MRSSQSDWRSSQISGDVPKYLPSRRAVSAEIGRDKCALAGRPPLQPASRRRGILSPLDSQRNCRSTSGEITQEIVRASEQWQSGGEYIIAGGAGLAGLVTDIRAVSARLPLAS